MPQLYQLADEPETYGADAGKWLIVSHDAETELSGPMDYEAAKAVLAVETSFTTMSGRDRAASLSWARAHDWGRTAYLEQAQGFVFVTIGDRDPTDPLAGGHSAAFIRGNGRLAFSSLNALRTWAGY